jgi:uncharacterized glyoxalase superfamily protein PhnB
MDFQAIPIIRIFDESKAKEFYLGFLGMTLDWEHRFKADLPIYMQVSKDSLVFHLSEHSGDGTPGTKILVNTDSLDTLFNEVTATEYRHSKPSIETAPWGARVFEVTDPFSNRIVFNEQ